jgi:hypothetical protein
MMFAPNSSRNGVGMIAMLQAFALAASLAGILSHRSLGLVENLSRQENSLIRHTDYLGAFTVSRGSKSLDGQPAGNILAAELFTRRADEAVHPIPNNAERTYRCGIFFISLIRSPPALFLIAFYLKRKTIAVVRLGKHP